MCISKGFSKQENVSYSYCAVTKVLDLVFEIKRSSPEEIPFDAIYPH